MELKQAQTGPKSEKKLDLTKTGTKLGLTKV